MTDIHRYKVVAMISEGGNYLGYTPHGPDVVMASVYDQLKAENEALRKIISESATACGAAVSVECSIEFMSMLPAEIGSIVEGARKDAERSKSMLLDACVQIGSIGEALGLDMDADADTMIGTARDLLEGLNRIAKECPLGSPGFAIACEVLGELGVQQEVQP